MYKVLYFSLWLLQIKLSWHSLYSI